MLIFFGTELIAQRKLLSDLMTPFGFQLSFCPFAAAALCSCAVACPLDVLPVPLTFHCVSTLFHRGQRDTPMEITDMDHLVPTARFGMANTDVAAVGFTSNAITIGITLHTAVGSRGGWLDVVMPTVVVIVLFRGLLLLRASGHCHRVPALWGIHSCSCECLCCQTFRKWPSRPPSLEEYPELTGGLFSVGSLFCVSVCSCSHIVFHKEVKCFPSKSTTPSSHRHIYCHRCIR